VELFIDLLCGTSHPLTSKPILKAAREGITIQAMCFVVAECKKSTAWRGLELQKMDILGCLGRWGSVVYSWAINSKKSDPFIHGIFAKMEGCRSIFHVIPST
jgi:hypothetical protein